ncbi:MAG: magnesium transporter [Thermoanaerobaculia bacterium]
MLKELLLPDIKELLKEKKFLEIKEGIKDWEAPEVADLLMELDEEEQGIFFRLLTRQQAAEVFSYLDITSQRNLLETFTHENIKMILQDLPPDDRTALLEELPAEVTRNLLSLLSPEDLKEARTLLGYPEDSVGRLMTPDYVALKPYVTVETALCEIRLSGKNKETIDRIYIVDDNYKLIDDIPLKELIFAEPEQKIEEIMDGNFVAISAYKDREEAVEMMKKYDLIALPVVDSNGVLVGIVTHDDILDVAEEEATEDIQRIAAVAPLDLPYDKTSIWTLFKKRVIWLFLLLFAYFFSSTLIAHYENLLNKIIALSFFLPMLIGSGGNTGSQSATLIVRALALKEIDARDWFKIFFKELLIGFLLGTTLSIFLFIRSATWQGIVIGVIVSVSLILIIIFANLIGALLPLFLSKIKVDPAVASSPFVTTLIDGTGIFIYFTVASLVLRKL